MDSILSSDLVRYWSGYLSPDRLVSFCQALIIIIVGWMLAGAISGAVRRVISRRFKQQQALILSKALFTLVMAIALISALRQLGFDLSIFIGAAGVLTLALGFASQISASNLISGLFLLGERPFEIGEVVRIGATSGEVLSVDLLSTKLKTLDNQIIRIPNESIIKSEVANLSRMPERRVDITIDIAHPTLPETVASALRGLAGQDMYLKNEPFFGVSNFIPGGYRLTMGFWTTTPNFSAARGALPQQVLKIIHANQGIRLLCASGVTAI